MGSSNVGDDAQLRKTLVSISASELSYGRWLATAEAQWLLAAIEKRISGIIITRFSRQHGIDFEPADIVHTAIELLANERLVDALDAASDQWAYLYRVISNEMLKQMGTRGTSPLEIAEQMAEPETHSSMPDFDNAMDLTVEVLAPLTPAALRPHLREVVEYLAERGQSRLSHAHTDSANDTGLIELGLERHHILALANVVLGARPDHGLNSILAGFLRDSDWKPSQSIPHRIALKKYGARMVRPSASEKKLVTAV
tara:strand:- start:18353 stop:19120 length:768 start_codon:yes stop_codon:yes gene_type:complete